MIGGVHVVGRGDHHRVDVLLLVEQHPIVFVLLGLGMGGERLARLHRVDVAECDDVLDRHLAEIAGPLAADPDAGDVQLLARRREPSAQHVPGDDLEPESRCAGGLQELATLHREDSRGSWMGKLPVSDLIPKASSTPDRLDQARIGRITLPATSVRRNLRPL